MTLRKNLSQQVYPEDVLGRQFFGKGFCQGDLLGEFPLRSEYVYRGDGHGCFARLLCRIGVSGREKLRVSLALASGDFEGGRGDARLVGRERHPSTIYHVRGVESVGIVVRVDIRIHRLYILQGITIQGF